MLRTMTHIKIKKIMPLGVLALTIGLVACQKSPEAEGVSSDFSLDFEIAGIRSGAAVEPGPCADVFFFGHYEK